MQFQSVPIPNLLLEELITAPGPALLGPGVRPSRLPQAGLASSLASVFQQAKVPPARQPLIRAAILLWHDHLDESHTLSQDIPGVDGAFLHGLMHRREPDYGNAKYWFHRVGSHPCFPLLLDRIQTGPPPADSSSFLGACRAARRWDPFAMVDACEEAAALAPDHPEARALREIQELELRVLLARFLVE